MNLSKKKKKRDREREEILDPGRGRRMGREKSRDVSNASPFVAETNPAPAMSPKSKKRSFP
jgi:hypothetical protein